METGMGRPDLRAMRLWIGEGSNNFTMSRGSFRYRQKIRNKRELLRKGTEQIPDGIRLLYADKKTGEEHALLIREREDGLKEVTYEGPYTAKEGSRFWIGLPAQADEHIYGCGETYSKFDLKGEKVRIWVAEHQNAGRITGKILRQKVFGKTPDRTLPFGKYESYYAQPTFVSSKRYFVHTGADRYSEMDFRGSGETILYFQEKPGFLYGEGDSFAEISEKLTAVLGRQAALPDWIYNGAILAIQGGTEVLREKVRKMREAGTKVCGIWSQDWCGCRRTGFGYQVMWNWEWDKELYPRLDEAIREWKEDGIRFLGYINPFIALEKDLYRIASAKGYCVKDKEGKDYQVTITTFPAAMVDFTNPEAYEWYKGLIKENMIGLGMGGWMADFGEYLPVDAVLYSGEDAASLHNRWPAIWAKMNREAIRECGVEGEVFFFTRAGHTGTIAASTMMWTGDQHVDWSVDDGLPSVIPATLSLAMSGYGVTHSDVGGYTTIMDMTREEELLLRWEEMNAFSPLFRTHEGNQPARNVQFDSTERLVEQMGRCSRWHEILKPYLQAAVREETQHGTPVMRPLFYHYDEEAAYTEKTEYLLGRDILVAPVLKPGQRNREVYLPTGDRWISLADGAEREGGYHMVDLPVGKAPAFIRKGSSWEELAKRFT